MNEEEWEERELMLKVVSKDSFPTEEKIESLIGKVLYNDSGQKFEVTDYIINDENGNDINIDKD